MSALHLLRTALLCLLVAPLGLAQELVQDSFLEDAGLQRQEVWDLAAGDSGEVWVAASDGLNRYDGYTWRRFTTDDGLPSNLVRSVCITADGVVWAGTDEGAVEFDGERFISDRVDNRLPGKHVAQIEQGSDGSLWFLCDTWNQLDLAGGVARWKDGEWATWNEVDGHSISAADRLEATDDGAALLMDGKISLLEGDTWQQAQFWGEGDEEPYALDLKGNCAGTLLVRSEIGLHLLPRPGLAWLRLEDPSDYNSDFAGTVTPNGVPRLVDNQVDAGLLEWKGGEWRRLGDVRVSSHWPFHSLLPGDGDDLWLAGAGTFQRLRVQDPRWRRVDTQDEVDRGVFSGVDGQGGVWYARGPGGFRRNAAGVIDVEFDDGVVWPAGEGTMWCFRGDGSIRLWTYLSDDSSGFWVDLPLPRDELGVIEDATALLDADGIYWAVTERTDGTWTIVSLDGVDAAEWQEWAAPETVTRDEIVVADHGPDGGIAVLHQDASSGRYGLIVVTAAGLVQLDVPGGWIREETPWMLVTEDGDLWLYGMRGLWQLAPDSTTLHRVEGLPGELILDLVHQPGVVASVGRALSGGRSALTLISAGHSPRVLRQWDLRLGECIGRGHADQIYFLEAENLIEVPADPGDVLMPYELPLGMTPISATRSGDGGLRVSDGEREYEYQPGRMPPRVVVADSTGGGLVGEPCLLAVGAIEYGRPHSDSGPLQYGVRLPGGDWSDWARLAGEPLDLGSLGAGDHAVDVRVMDQSGLVGTARTSFVVRPVPLRDRAWFLPLLTALSLSFMGLSFWAMYSRGRIGDLASRLQTTVEQRSEQLATSEARYHNLFVQSGEGLLVLDSERRIEDANPAARRLLGLDQDEALGMGFDVFLEDPQTRAEVLGGQDALLSCQLTNRSGDLVEVLLGCSPLREAGKSQARYQVSLRDLGDRAHLEQSLEVRQEQLDLALAGSRGATWEVRSQFSEEGKKEHMRVSQRFLQQLGFSPDSVPSSVSEWQGLIHPDDRPRLPRILERNQELGPMEYSSEYRLNIPGKGYRWVRSIARMTHDPLRETTRWFGVHWDVTDQMERQSALQEREERYRRLAENLPGFVFLCEAVLPHRIVFVTSQIEKLLGYTVEDVLADSDFYTRIAHPEDRGVRAEARAAMASGKRHLFQARGRHGDGSWRWFEISLGRPIAEPTGPIIEGYVQDITDRLREEEQRQLMMRELDHRVKNTLATVVAIADRTRAGSTTLEGFDEAFRGRLHTLARVHEALAGGGWAGVDVRTLVERCVAPYQGESSVTLEGPKVELPVDAVTTFSMALNELSTNAAKYGALSVPNARIHVRWGILDEDGAPNLEFNWVESGGPEVPSQPTPGFGTRLIEQGIAYEQGGFVDMDFGVDGLRCSLRLPLVQPRRKPLG